LLRGTQQHPTTFHYHWRRLLQAAGIRHGITIHDLRRTAAFTVWEATKDLKKVQHVLGHSLVSTTARYLHNPADQEELRNTFAAIDHRRTWRKEKDTSQ
jgi:integrase